MSSASKTIGGFLVEVEVVMEDGQPVSSCTISKGKYASSLRLAQEIGGIENHDDGSVLTIPEPTIENIEKFADDNGY